MTQTVTQINYSMLRGSVNRSRSVLKKEMLLEEFCDTLDYPIYYLGIKAVQTPGAKKVKYLPYQYSVHVEYSNGYIEHKEFIAKDKKSLQKDFANALCKDIPLDSTIMSNQIECVQDIFKQLALLFPQHGYHLLILLDNLKDLTLPFKEDWNDLSHMNDNLNFIDIEEFIHGSKCCNKEFEWGLEQDYVSLLEQSTSLSTQLQSSLLEYSKMDTLLMVEILKKLRSL